MLSSSAASRISRTVVGLAHTTTTASEDRQRETATVSLHLHARTGSRWPRCIMTSLSAASAVRQIPHSGMHIGYFEMHAHFAASVTTPNKINIGTDPKSIFNPVM
jgi:hypothetical protein